MPRYTSPIHEKDILAHIKARYSSEDLDSEVFQTKSREASDINNGGIDKQLEFLVEAWGLGALETYFLSN